MPYGIILYSVLLIIYSCLHTHCRLSSRLTENHQRSEGKESHFFQDEDNMAVGACQWMHHCPEPMKAKLCCVVSWTQAVDSRNEGRECWGRANLSWITPFEVSSLQLYWPWYQLHISPDAAFVTQMIIHLILKLTSWPEPWNVCFLLNIIFFCTVLSKNIAYSSFNDTRY